jgi:hypothetical protein
MTVVTVRGTLHIFAINPYGGTPTGASRVLGSERVIHITEPQPCLCPLFCACTCPLRLRRPGACNSGAQDVFVLDRATAELMLKQCVVRMQSTSTIERSMQASTSLPSALFPSVAGSGMSALSSMIRGGVVAVAVAGGGGKAEKGWCWEVLRRGRGSQGRPARWSTGEKGQGFAVRVSALLAGSQLRLIRILGGSPRQRYRPTLAKTAPRPNLFFPLVCLLQPL